MKIKTAVALLLFPLAIISCRKEEKKTVESPAKLPADSVRTAKVEDKIDYSNFNIYSIAVISSAQKDARADVFISVSDIYKDPNPIQEDIFKKQKSIPSDQLQYLELDPKHRKKMLDGLHLTENDSLYLYNYQFNKLQKMPLHKLKAVAYLDGYSLDSEEVDPSSYMVGFQVAAQQNNDVSEKYYNAIAYFGNKNPFIEGKMQAIAWKKTGSDISKKYFTDSKLKPGNTFQAQYENLKYYLQDYLEDEVVIERKLVVINDQNEKIFEKTITTAGMDAELSPLNGIDTDGANPTQWTGSLFKGKPPVSFGFIAHYFGCSSITFLDKKEKPIVINCDNRH
ncbi:hypothetical protein C1637_19800 [Chryseobacterium lactis]|uniref:Oxidoreductase n=1 Tax=Chryseobacterium lactis TaxID=1241981 RepID=A0A3G6RNP9_CHRLC|nr:hypothetical protein [Chryseobacterium lactis]AZA83113.1 hypothetical protein EG342_15015 [Chryseobacterium lactis]AZB03496.1 hypothetical protein EG341_05885 [Chryseobacterium lactis]PNW12000.1 hypothetical protein C1637_19800 [Chryseobacterium lactis]